MDTLLFVFTTAGNSREDGNVYYASYLLVVGSPADREAIADSIAKLLGGHVTPGGHIKHPYVEDAPLDHEAMITELALEGWQARWANTTVVIEEE